MFWTIFKTIYNMSIENIWGEKNIGLVVIIIIIIIVKRKKKFIWIIILKI